MIMRMDPFKSADAGNLLDELPGQCGMREKYPLFQALLHIPLFLRYESTDNRNNHSCLRKNRKYNRWQDRNIKFCTSGPVSFEVSLKPFRKSVEGAKRQKRLTACNCYHPLLPFFIYYILQKQDASPERGIDFIF